MTTDKIKVHPDVLAAVTAGAELLTALDSEHAGELGVDTAAAANRLDAALCDLAVRAPGTAQRTATPAAATIAEQNWRAEVALWLIDHWQDTIFGKPLYGRPLYEWCSSNAVALGGVLAAAAKVKALADSNQVKVQR